MFCVSVCHGYYKMCCVLLLQGNFFQNLGSIMVFAVVGTTISAAIVGGGLYALGLVSIVCTCTHLYVNCVSHCETSWSKSVWTCDTERKILCIGMLYTVVGIGYTLHLSFSKPLSVINIGYTMKRRFIRRFISPGKPVYRCPEREARGRLFRFPRWYKSPYKPIVSSYKVFILYFSFCVPFNDWKVL